MGRYVAPDDDAVGAPNVVVLAHSVWQERFGADPGILGRALSLDSENPIDRPCPLAPVWQALMYRSAAPAALIRGTSRCMLASIVVVE